MATALDKIRAFKKAYMDLVEEWDSNSVMEDLDQEWYPFNMSFDELGVVDWCDDMEEQLTLMPHGKAMHDLAIREIRKAILSFKRKTLSYEAVFKTVELYHKQFSISEEEYYKFANQLKEEK